MTERPESIEVEAPNLEDAVAEALARLGARRHEVEVETLAEGRSGFFGIGAAPARVRVRRRAADRRDGRGRDGRDRDRRPGPRSEDREDRPRRPASSFTERAARPDVPCPEAAVRPAAAAETAPAAEAAIGALRDLIAACGIPGDVEGAWDEEYRGVRLDLAVSDDDSALLVGRRGATLNAFQYLTAVLAGRRLGTRVRVVLDLDGFRERRAESLEGLARRAVGEARRTGKTVDLDPMPPQDRRIIHMFLADEDGIDVHSEGEGNRRHIVITPVGPKSDTAPIQKSDTAPIQEDRPPRRAGRGRRGGGDGRRRHGPRRRDDRRAESASTNGAGTPDDDFVPPTDAAIEWIRKPGKKS